MTAVRSLPCNEERDHIVRGWSGSPRRGARIKPVALAAAFLFTLLAGAEMPAQAAACRPAGMSRAALDTLKAGQWAVADEASRNALARGLVSCLGDPDPAVRDGLAFEGLQHLMRNNQLTTETLATLQDALEANLASRDPQGFRNSFSALVLAEVVRSDRIQRWMTPERRARALDAAVRYLTDLRDHRGFDPRQGYRHAPAHAGDLMMQIVLNTGYGKPELARVLAAIASQAAPSGHFYIHGESERLARPVLLIAQRNLFSEAEWTAWFSQLSGPGSLGRWDDWFRSEAGLARRHDLSMFLLVLHANISLGGNPETFAPMRPGLVAAIQAVP